MVGRDLGGRGEREEKRGTGSDMRNGEQERSPEVQENECKYAASGVWEGEGPSIRSPGDERLSGLNGGDLSENVQQLGKATCRVCLQ